MRRKRATPKDMTIYCAQCRAPIRGMSDSRIIESKSVKIVACKDAEACNVRREAMLTGRSAASVAE